MQEEWRTVVYNGETYDDYEVSNMGKIRSLNYRHTGKPKELVLNKDTHGYLQIALWKNGTYKTRKVHTLVAWTWIPNPENKPTVNHINEDKTDNRVENLEWSTMKEQNEHGTRTERTRKKVKCIETDITYDSVTQAEQETGVWGTRITRCCRHKCKTAGGYHWKYVN